MWIQNLLVALCVLAALLVALWRLPGAATRRRYVGWLTRWGGGRGVFAAGSAWLARRLARRLGSGGCADCHGAAPGPGPRRG